MLDFLKLPILGKPVKIIILAIDTWAWLVLRARARCYIGKTKAGLSEKPINGGVFNRFKLV